MVSKWASCFNFALNHTFKIVQSFKGVFSIKTEDQKLQWNWMKWHENQLQQGKKEVVFLSVCIHAYFWECSCGLQQSYPFVLTSSVKWLSDSNNVSYSTHLMPSGVNGLICRFIHCQFCFYNVLLWSSTEVRTGSTQLCIKPCYFDGDWILKACLDLVFSLVVFLFEMSLLVTLEKVGICLCTREKAAPQVVLICHFLQPWGFSALSND